MDLRRLFLPSGLLPDSLTGGGKIAHMHHRLIAILVLVCFAFGAGGCELFQSSKPKSSRKKKRYKKVLLPPQTGSNVQRHAYVEDDTEAKRTKKPKKRQSPSPKPDAEPSDTPPPTEEESPAPTPERFR